MSITAKCARCGKCTGIFGGTRIHNRFVCKECKERIKAAA